MGCYEGLINQVVFPELWDRCFVTELYLFLFFFQCDHPFCKTVIHNTSVHIYGKGRLIKNPKYFGNTLLWLVARHA